MQLTKWSPWHNLNNLHCHLNTAWAHGCNRGLTDNRAEQNGAWSPAVDVFESITHITIKAELPGVGKDNIAVSLKDRVLSLSGERRFEAPQDTDKAYRQERVFGRFERSFILPAEFEAEKISADYKDGVLTIEVPKPDKQQPRKITVH